MKFYKNDNFQKVFRAYLKLISLFIYISFLICRLYRGFRDLRSLVINVDNDNAIINTGMKGVCKFRRDTVLSRKY